MTEVRSWLRTARTGFWLGWEVNSNWAEPWLFFVYSVVRPVFGALILVFMFFAVASGRQGPMLGFFVIGTAFWPLVLGGTQGMALTVIEDREQWRTVRYIYTAPVRWTAYLVGRALARTVAVGVPGALVTLVAAALLLDVRLDGSAAGLGYAAAATALGVVSILAVGLTAVAAAVTFAGEAWRLPEAVSAALYLVTGAIFPPPLLPGPVEAVAVATPLTWWLEALRRGLLGPGAAVSYPGLSDGAVLALLAALTIVWAVAARALFALSERRARKFGTLDRESSF